MKKEKKKEKQPLLTIAIPKKLQGKGEVDVLSQRLKLNC